MPIEVHLERRIINNNVIREADTKSHRDYIVLTVLGGILLIGLFIYAWQHYQWIQYGYRIEEAQKKKEQLVEVRGRLQLERASLRNPQRIDKIARRDLGMVGPSPGQLVPFSADAPLLMPAAPVQPQPAVLSAKR